MKHFDSQLIFSNLELNIIFIKIDANLLKGEEVTFYFCELLISTYSSFVYMNNSCTVVKINNSALNFSKINIMQSNFIFLCFVIGFNILHLESHCRNAILGLKWSPIPMTNFVKVPPFVLMKIIRVFFLILRYMYFLFLIQGRKECSRGNHSSTSNSSNEPNGCSTDR